MSENVKLGIWRLMLSLPPVILEKQFAAEQRKFRKANRFMTEQHRSVHHAVVRELPHAGGPLSPSRISECCDIPVDTVRSILDDLERHMTFLVRNDQGNVIWAYPVTVVETPHRLHFDSGETLYAA